MAFFQLHAVRQYHLSRRPFHKQLGCLRGELALGTNLCCQANLSRKRILRIASLLRRTKLEHAGLIPEACMRIRLFSRGKSSHTGIRSNVPEVIQHSQLADMAPLGAHSLS